MNLKNVNKTRFVNFFTFVSLISGKDPRTGQIVLLSCHLLA
jgi:hypothetical protein